MQERSERVTRVLVAMSGGVDSSVTAALLQEQGYDLVGVTLHLWDAQGEHQVGRCCAPEDREDARLSCEHLGVPHYTMDERVAFRQEVVEPFKTSYLNGLTPSPCVICNQQVKLGRLLQIADELGASHVATGHYARLLETDEGRVRVLRGKDQGKDQSYFLYGVAPDVLRRMLCPLGEMQKGETREHGRRLGVPNWDKGDSQELCFVPDGDIGGFIEREESHRGGGKIVDEEGGEVGAHQGIYRFTVGQRRGLGLGGHAVPRYVLRILPDSDQVVVGPEASLFSSEARVSRCIWTGVRPTAPFEAFVQVRYRHQAAAAFVTPTETGFYAEFKEPQRAIAPGQAAVIYCGDEAIGGGEIDA